MGKKNKKSKNGGETKKKLAEQALEEEENSESEMLEEGAGEEAENSDVEEEEENLDIEGEENENEEKEDPMEAVTEEQDRLQMESLAGLAKLKKPATSKKEKERKVIDFKFRVVELLEIFLHKSKNPEIFLSAIVPLINVMKETLKERTQTNYITKLSLLMKKFFTKNLHFQEETLANLDECLKEIIYVLAKTRQKSFCQTLNGVALSLIKVRIKTKGDDDSKESVFSMMKAAFEKQMKKRDVYYSDELFKEFFKINEAFVSRALPLLIQNCNIKNEEGAKDDFNRGRALDLLKFCLRTKVNGFNPYVDLIQNNIKPFSKMVTGVLSGHGDLKKSKISFLNKLTDTLADIKQNISRVEESRAENEKKIVAEGWKNDEDEKLKGVKERLLQKLHLK